MTTLYFQTSPPEVWSFPAEVAEINISPQSAISGSHLYIPLSFLLEPWGGAWWALLKTLLANSMRQILKPPQLRYGSIAHAFFARNASAYLAGTQMNISLTCLHVSLSADSITYVPINCICGLWSMMQHWWLKHQLKNQRIFIFLFPFLDPSDGFQTKLQILQQLQLYTGHLPSSLHSHVTVTGQKSNPSYYQDKTSQIYQWLCVEFSNKSYQG